MRNILSNKLTALFRSEPKDVVNIHAIALQQNFNWRDIVTEAKSKGVGADPEGEIDMDNLQDLTKKTEKYINRKIRTLALTEDEYQQLAGTLSKRPQFLLWQLKDNDDTE